MSGAAPRNLYQNLRRLSRDPRTRRLIGAGGLLLSVGFLAFLLASGWEELRAYDAWNTYLSAAAAGFLLYPLSLVVQAWVWHRIISMFGRGSNCWRDMEIYAYSHLMRRLPGMVWYLAGRTARYYGQGIKTEVTLAASALEWFLLLAAAALIYATLSLFRASGVLLNVLLLCLVVVTVSLLLRWSLSLSGFRRLSAWAPKRMRVLTGAPLPGVKDLFLWLLLYVVAYFLAGGILLLLIGAVTPGSSPRLLDATRIWALSGGLSFFLSAIIPAGLGVREVSLALLLSPFVPSPATALIPIVMRLLFVSSDLVWGSLLWIVARTLCRRKERTSLYDDPGD